MAEYVLIVDFQPGVAEPPMEEWKPEEVTAREHYRAAAGRATNLAEQRYLSAQAARLAASLSSTR